jgi:methionyl-tRNA formyltransferase
VQLNGERIKLYCAHAGSGSNAEPGTIVDVSKQGISVACSEGQLVITELQIPGKKSTPVAAVLNGYADKFQIGNRFSLP